MILQNKQSDIEVTFSVLRKIVTEQRIPTQLGVAEDCHPLSAGVLHHSLSVRVAQSSLTRYTEPVRVSVSRARASARCRSSLSTRTRTHQSPTGLRNLSTLAVR